MSAPITTPEGLIKSFGGSGPFSREIGVKQTTGSEMKRRNSIPVAHWPAVVAAAKRCGVRGVTYELLVRIHVERVRVAS